MPRELQHMLFLTSAAFDADGAMEVDDRARITAIAEMIHEGKIDACKTLFVMEGNLASLETAHHMADLLCYRKEKTRQMTLGSDFWARPEVADILSDISRREAFDEDLWLFVGSTKYVLRALAVLFPERHEVYGVTGELPSAVCIGLTARLERFFSFTRRNISSLN